MKQIGVLLGLVLPLLCAALSGGSPLRGKRALGYEEIPAGIPIEFKEEFRGGERACVIVRGNHKPVVDLGVFIYDDKGQLVAEDSGGGDYVAAIWYPPRNAVYKVKIFNPGAQPNKCWISLK